MKIKGFVPNLFLSHLGVSEKRPAWYVMLLAAMASGALYTAFWLAVFIIIPLISTSYKSPFIGSALYYIIVVFMMVAFWGSSTLWYHLIYLRWYKQQTAPKDEEDEPRATYGILGTPLFWLLAAVCWLMLKLILIFVPPLIPFIFVIDLLGRGLGSLPVVGNVLFVIILLALMLYPFIALGVHAVGRRRSRNRELSNG